jgi:phosphatidyl-myo-inositol dimannoside synthase
MAAALSKHLARAGAEVRVLTKTEPDAEEVDDRQELPITRLPLGSTDTWRERIQQKRFLTLEIRRVLDEYDPDCVLCLQWDPCAYLTRSAIRADRRGIPYFLVAHGMELFQLPQFAPLRWSKARLRKWALMGARRIFAVSEYTRQRVLTLGVPEALLSVIPNGVEVGGEVSRARNGYRPFPVLLTVARLVPRKGHGTVLQALPSVLEKIRVQYQIVGAGPEREALEREVNARGLAEHVRFYGEVSNEEKERLLSECDIFLSPSRETATDFEGFGIALLEAMQHKKPVIATRGGGMSEVVVDGKTGLLVAPDDFLALSENVLSLLKHPVEARRLGENGWRTVQHQYRWDRIAQQYLAEIERGLAE